jgi:hypothetical protein
MTAKREQPGNSHYWTGVTMTTNTPVSMTRRDRISNMTGQVRLENHGRIAKIGQSRLNNCDKIESRAGQS